jgi:hypothetical protein
MSRALDHLRAQGLEIDPENVARLSPLGYSHINMLGRYYFKLAEALKEGGLGHCGTLTIRMSCFTRAEDFWWKGFQP